MEAPPKRRIAAVALVTFLVAVNLQWVLTRFHAYTALYARYPFWVPEGGKSVLQILLCALALALLYRIGARSIIRELGLAAPVLRSVAFAFVASAPLLLGLAATGHLAPNLSWPKELYTAFFGNLAEDIVFTGFAFRQLYRRAGWPFWLAVATTAVLFGLGHIEKGTTATQVIGLFLIPGLGQALFAWLFVRWGDNLWVPFALHCFMDFWWDLFAVGDTVLGGAFPFVLQIATALAAILLTRWWRPFPRIAPPAAALERTPA